jgi:secreted trypsin-like serine protease
LPPAAVLATLISFVLASLVPATVVPATAVVHGTPLAHGSLKQPWAVALYYAAPGSTASFLCSGTLISQQTVVTAAHCVRPFTAGDLYVQVGSDRLGGGRRIAVDGKWWDPKYRPRFFPHDLGVLHLVVPAHVTVVAKLATAPTSGRGTSTLYGWGVDEKDRLPGYLRAATLTNLDAVAHKAYGSAFLPATMIAAGHYVRSLRRFRAACSGDSGGPLIQYAGRVPVLVGVVSFGTQPCDLAPTVFTRVSAYRALLARGVAAATARAKRASLAAPVNLSAPTVTGVAQQGQVLTCNPGRWTANARRFVVAWSAVDRSTVHGATLTVTRDLTGTSVSCRVTAVGFRHNAAADSKAYAVPAVAASLTWVATATSTVLHGHALAATDTSDRRITAWCVSVDSMPLSRDIVDISAAGNDLLGVALDASGCYSADSGDLRDGYLDLSLLGAPSGSHTVQVTVIDAFGRASAFPAQVLDTP